MDILLVHWYATPSTLGTKGKYVGITMSLWAFWTAQLFVTKLGMVVHDHEQECYAKKMGSYLQGQGHTNSQHKTFYCVFWTDILLQPGLFLW